MKGKVEINCETRRRKDQNHQKSKEIQGNPLNAQRAANVRVKRYIMLEMVKCLEELVMTTSSYYTTQFVFHKVFGAFQVIVVYQKIFRSTYKNLPTIFNHQS